MSVTRTYTVTVVSTGSGNKYFIDGVQQDTLNLFESGTYKLDQSDSSNSGHPLRFSTTSDGTHNSGSQYTTGVTTSGTPGQSGAYTQIEVATDAPTLYYYCTVHSGMGGQANTPAADTWGALGWSTNRWGTNAEITTGWGAEAWDTGGSWGQANDELVSLTGLSITASLGTPVASAQQGWGRDLWGEEPWGESFDPVVKPSGLGMTSASGSVSVSTEINKGWGQDEWGEENWGQSGFTFELTAPDAIQSFVGTGSRWNDGAWGQDQAWGTYTITPADVVGLTGQEITSAVPSQFDIPEQISGQAITSAVGSLTTVQEIVGLTGQAITPAVGSLAPADVVGLTGVSATASVGSITTGSVEIITPTGVSATASVGDIDPIPMVVGLTGVSFTGSVGSVTIADESIGLSGQSITSSVAAFGTASGFGIQAYSDVDTGSNSSYTDVATGSNTSYSDAA
jgi:hypothetical protein